MRLSLLLLTKPLTALPKKWKLDFSFIAMSWWLISLEMKMTTGFDVRPPLNFVWQQCRENHLFFLKFECIFGNPTWSSFGSNWVQFFYFYRNCVFWLTSSCFLEFLRWVTNSEISLFPSLAVCAQVPSGCKLMLGHSDFLCEIYFS